MKILKAIAAFALSAAVLAGGAVAFAAGDSSDELPFVGKTAATAAAYNEQLDVNSDKVVDISDVTELQKYIAAVPGIRIDPETADTNGDGVVDIRDATFIQKYLIGKVVLETIPIEEENIDDIFG